VAAALLNGYGAEINQDELRDIDDERRMKKLNATNIGGNRGQQVTETRKAAQEESIARIKKQIEKSHNTIKDKVKRRRNHESPQYTFDDVKELIAATFQAFRDERDRATKLQKGGGDAARILAKERKAHRSFEAGPLVEEEDDSTTRQNIKPGEVSLVSSFSCLHPSVDGVDAILREGVATAAAALATQQLIAMQSLMSAFHLATLYRDGFRYSDKMWIAEVSLSMNLDSLRYGASCTPRPRLPSSVLRRPPSSMFETGSLVSTVLQALSHLAFMSWTVSYVKSLQEMAIQTERCLIKNRTPFGTRLEKLVNILSASPIETKSEDEKKPFHFFRRPPFQPNYETNVVFMFSVLQAALSVLVSHQGKPYYQSVLESRAFCRLLCFIVAFFVICVTGSMPRITSFLDVKPFPTWQSKVVIVALAIGNVVACVLSRWIAARITSTTKRDTEDSAKNPKTESDVAADLEEKLLQEEEEMNARGVKVFVGVIMYILVDIVADATRNSGKQLTPQ
jgi:hypothetical protein